MVRWLCASAVPDMPYFPLSLCRMARACLNLMAAMVTQGPEAARDVCSHFDLNKKTLYTLATKRDSKVRSPEHPPSPMCFLSLQSFRGRSGLFVLLSPDSVLTQRR